MEPEGSSMLSTRMLNIRVAVFGIFLALTVACAPLASPDSAGSGRPAIEVWFVGSPYQSGLPLSRVPPDLEREAEARGFRLNVRAIAAHSFKPAFLSARAT